MAERLAVRIAKHSSITTISLLVPGEVVTPYAFRENARCATARLFGALAGECDGPEYNVA
jgi:hypothetical protein